MVFMGCAAIAMSASMAGRSCTDWGWVRQDGICQGSKKRCEEANAVTAFEWIAAVGFAGSVVLGAVAWGRGRQERRVGRNRVSV